MTAVSERTPPAYIEVLLHPMNIKGYYGVWTHCFYNAKTNKKVDGVTHWTLAISRTLLTDHFRHTYNSN
jgi:hypothetical protein